MGTLSELRADENDGAKRRQAGVYHSCGDVIVNVVGNRKTARPRHNGAFRHATVRRPRATEEHPRTVVKAPNSIHAAHDGQFAVRCVVRAAGHLLIDGFERRGPNVNDHLVFFRNGFGKLREVRVNAAVLRTINQPPAKWRFLSGKGRSRKFHVLSPQECGGTEPPRRKRRTSTRICFQEARG